MEENISYRIGLDIGITSVGWAALLTDSNDQPCHILDMGVRIFDRAENPKNGDSLAAPRRGKRSLRRVTRRRRHRMERIKYLFEQSGLITRDELEQMYHSEGLPDVYQLRAESLDRKLTNAELAQVLLHIAKHRGFKSNRKSELKGEAGEVLKAVEANRALMEEKKYRTVGEMMYKDPEFQEATPWSATGTTHATRNKAGDYRHMISRKAQVEEVQKIFKAQRELGNAAATEDLEKQYLEIMQSQRSFDMGPGKQADGSDSPYTLNGFGNKAGNCSFAGETHPRAPKAAFTSEYFVALQKINHIRLTNEETATSVPLDPMQRDMVIDLLFEKKEVKYSDIRKKLKLEENTTFNITYTYGKKKKKAKAEESDTEVMTRSEAIRKAESAKCVTMRNYYEMRDAMGLKIKKGQKPFPETVQLLDAVAKVLTEFKNDDKRSELLAALDLNGEQIGKLLALNPSKYLHLSYEAMARMLPFLQKGEIYSDAYEHAGGDGEDLGERKRLHTLRGKEITDIINEITNPVVRRAVSQAVKVVNAIINRYGSPQGINIELAREVAQPFEERKNREKWMNERSAANEQIKNRIRELGIMSPKGQDIVKYRLWQDQQGMDLYTGKKIPLEGLFAPGAYEVDHILPYSRSFDDSYHNKVLTAKLENQQKGNCTPYEYFGGDAERWSRFETLVNSCPDHSKRLKFLRQSFTEEDSRDYKSRQLNDTKYISRVVLNMIQDYLEFAPFNNPEHKRRVYAVNGAVTTYLRKRWGLPNKDRETDTHHSVDAVIIASCTSGTIQKVTRYMEYRESRLMSRGYFIDPATGEKVLKSSVSRKEWDEKFGLKVPAPWPYFREEVDLRSSRKGDVRAYLLEHRDLYKKFNYPRWMYEDDIIRPIFVSRMPNHKVTGPAHKDTVRSGVLLDEGYTVSRVPLTSLKRDKKSGEIAGYYMPESDRLLYEALKSRLVEFGWDAEKAFAEEFHKPKADGTPGPVVKKVKIYEKATKGVRLKNNGVADNDTMVRIDVFRKDGKYYYVPIYVADTLASTLPNRAATHTKPYSQWRVMEDKNFLFSLYARDLIHLKIESGIKIKHNDGTTERLKEVWAYFDGANIATASISLISDDREFSGESIGIQKMEIFEKCQVDMLGRVSVVGKEKRMQFRRK